MSKRGELLTKVCPQCGKEFSFMKSQERKYCSKECFKNSKQTGTNIKCDNCGKCIETDKNYKVVKITKIIQDN